MNDRKIEVKASPRFEKRVDRYERKYRHIRDDLDVLTWQLEAGETPGARIKDTRHNFFKFRLKSSDVSGKPFFRVIYYLHLRGEIYYVLIYPKNELDDISGRELDALADEIDAQIKKERKQ